MCWKVIESEHVFLWDFPAVMPPPTHTQSHNYVQTSLKDPFLLFCCPSTWEKQIFSDSANSIWEVHLIESPWIGFYIHVHNTSLVLELVFCLNEAQQPHLQAITLGWTQGRETFSSMVFSLFQVYAITAGRGRTGGLWNVFANIWWVVLRIWYQTNAEDCGKFIIWNSYLLWKVTLLYMSDSLTKYAEYFHSQEHTKADFHEYSPKFKEPLRMFYFNESNNNNKKIIRKNYSYNSLCYLICYYYFILITEIINVNYLFYGYFLNDLFLELVIFSSFISVFSL